MITVGGIDVGGTKCAVSIGEVDDQNIRILVKEKIATPREPQEAVLELVRILKKLVRDTGVTLHAVGISCGSPLDSVNGIIKEPPNLPGWIDVDIVTPFKEAFHVPAAVQNDANACALAEWMWGAGQGYDNMIFLTFGTGLGAGLILGGKLYAGTSDMAGEVGHIRLEENGPIGYNKAGSFEGFCSGGGIANLGKSMMESYRKAGRSSIMFELEKENRGITAEDIGKAARMGDELALSIFRVVGTKLGKGLAVLIDILNPEVIVIGSIFVRQEQLLREPMEKKIREEALPMNASDCRVVSAKLGENLGDYAAFSVAMNCLRRTDV